MNDLEDWTITDIMGAVHCSHVQAKGCTAKLRALGHLESTRPGHGHRTALYRITADGMRQVEAERLPTAKAAIQSRSALEMVWGAR